MTDLPPLYPPHPEACSWIQETGLCDCWVGREFPDTIAHLAGCASADGADCNCRRLYGQPSLVEELVSKVAEVRGWWETVSAADFEKMAPKIGEYTAADLEIMGIVMEKWGIAAPEGGGGMEASIIWYILGKVARAVAAYREGRQPSEDTLHDITVYSMMARRVRETGGWP